MNERPPDRDEADEVDELYRRASALDSSRPSDTARKAVLAHAERLAAERRGHTARRQKNPIGWWRPAVFGSVAAAALAGLMLLPRILPLLGKTEEVTVTGYARQASASAEPPASSQEVVVAPAE